MPRSLQRAGAVLVAGFGIGALVHGLLLGRIGPVTPVLAGLLVAGAAGAAAVGLWRGAAWTPRALIALGLAGVVDLILWAVTFGAEAEMWVVVAIAAAIFFGLCRLVARSVRRSSRPAI